MLRPFAHTVAGCWMLLHVVAKSLKLVKLFSQQLPTFFLFPWSPKRSATMLDPFAQLFQHCWGHARSLCKVYKDLWVVSFPRCPAGSNIVGSCCICLHTAANTHETYPNSVGATMLEVVAFVCTQPYNTWFNFTCNHSPRGTPPGICNFFFLGGLFPTPAHAERDNSPPPSSWLTSYLFFATSFWSVQKQNDTFSQLL